MKFAIVLVLIGSILPPIFGLHLFVGTGPSTQDKIKNRARRDVDLVAPPVVTSYHITSSITARYVSTSAVATLVNEDEVSQEAAFTFQMTPGAFISDFIMIVDGVTYKAQIQERQMAEKAYDQAVSKGESAAQVSQDSDASARFKIDLNIQGDTTVVFNLTYQELLLRDKGLFTHKIYVAAGQVTDLRVDVNILEPQGLTVVDATWDPEEDGIIPEVTFDSSESTTANVVFNPSKQDQSHVSGTDGLSGLLIVSYDVEHNLDGGDLLISNGYFVHHISPEGLPPAPKKVIFVIDVSASMWGPKMTQTTAAMVSILDELRDIDSFNILLFSNDVEYWKESPVPASIENKLEAQEYVRCLRAKSATNIYDALVAATNQFNVTDDAYPAIVFLTDGRPNVGVIDPRDIVDSVNKAIGERVALFCIGIGPDVDDALLEALATENQGLYRKVFIDSSAAVQMCGFFGEVATPLLYHVSIRYKEGAVDKQSLTDDEFLSYFDGKELVVAGKVSDEFDGDSLDVVVTGKGRQDDVELDVSKKLNERVSPGIDEGFAERMWAFLTIKECLKRARRHSLPQEEQPGSQELNAKALELSLKYSFVTSMASLLILRPPEIIPTESIPLATSSLPLIRPQPLTPEAPEEQQSKEDASQVKPGSPSSRVGADPHFIIDVPHTNLTICFDIQANDGTTLSLISDPVRDIYVSAKVKPVEKSRPHARPLDSPPPSLLGSLGVQLGYYKVLVTTENVVVDSEIVMQWGTARSVIIGSYNITIHNARNLTIMIDDDIQMHVTLHNHWRNHPDHIDFFVQTEGGFSRKVHGLLGQFQYKPIHMLNPLVGHSANGHIKGILNVDGHKKNVFKMKEAIDQTYDCWWSLPETYIDGETEQYFLADYFSRFNTISV
ncbi:inter-alpha-trypsin inhibitor heavy chain H3-like [Apostichopus japonicus]|uniref:inter-alpha-trypsin inhibitor heavy chain H3-like n=1 Tax=Stichopus japonicus TaxID=307972 RepID=UPI003AB4873E